MQFFWLPLLTVSKQQESEPEEFRQVLRTDMFSFSRLLLDLHYMHKCTGIYLIFVVWTIVLTS